MRWREEGILGREMCVKVEKYGTIWPGMAGGGLRQISSGQWKALCAKLGDLDTL